MFASFPLCSAVRLKLKLWKMESKYSCLRYASRAWFQFRHTQSDLLKIDTSLLKSDLLQWMKAEINTTSPGLDQNNRAYCGCIQKGPCFSSYAEIHISLLEHLQTHSSPPSMHFVLKVQVCIVLSGYLTFLQWGQTGTLAIQMQEKKPEKTEIVLT